MSHPGTRNGAPLDVVVAPGAGDVPGAPATSPTYRGVMPPTTAEQGDTRWTRLRESLRTGLWFVPILFVGAAAVLSLITVTIDQHLGGTGWWLFFDGGPTSAEQILATIAASMITVTGLVFTITVVVLQLASNQFSPRVLRTFLRDRGSQIPLGVFTATFVYSLFVLVRVRTGVVGAVFVPRLSVSVSFALIVASMLALVYFVNHVAQSIRAVNIIESVAAETREAIDVAFPPGPDTAPEVDPPELGTLVQTIRLERHGGVIDGLNINALVAMAQAHDCVLQMVPAMGEFVPEQAPLFEVFDATSPVNPGRSWRRSTSGTSAPCARTLRTASGCSQTSPRRPCHPLSTTRRRPSRRSIGSRTSSVVSPGVPSRPASTTTIAGTSGSYARSSAWDALVTLAFEEIREYGSSSMQVHRRLRAAIEQLLEVVPDQRRAPLWRQLHLLELSESRNFPDAEERALAAEPDESGIGTLENEQASESRGGTRGGRSRPCGQG